MFDQDEIRIISGILDQGVAEGRFSIPDVHTAAVVIVTAFRDFEYPFSLSAGSPEIETLDSLLEVVFKGILRR
jgi:hypothetical protein